MVSESVPRAEVQFLSSDGLSLCEFSKKITDFFSSRQMFEAIERKRPEMKFSEI